jgi:hypothetical protein
LLEPGADNARINGHVTFRWSYPRPLAPDEGFQVLAWKDGNPHWGVAGLTGETQQTVNLDGVLPGRGGAGDYWWTVVVRELGTEDLRSPEASPRRFTYLGASSGGGGSGEEPGPCDACVCQNQCNSRVCHECCAQCCEGCG